MKTLIIGVVEALPEGLFWVTGRCCEEDISVGNILYHDTKPEVRVKVKEIEVYHKKRDILAHGYAGGVIVELLDGGILPNSGCLVDVAKK